jgi:hypothetical protein
MTKRRQKVLVIIAGAAAAYFSISSIFWIIYFLHSSVPIQEPIRQVIIALPCFLLAAAFWVAVVQVLRARTIASFTVTIAIVLAVLLFWYDVSHHNYQSLFYTKQGNTPVYVTWWWFAGTQEISWV